MKTSKVLFAVLAAGLFGGGVIVFKAHAAERAAGSTRSRARLLERAKENLGLTDDQISRIKNELKSDKDSLKGLISGLHEARTGLREAIQASDATEASVRAASAKVASVEADLAVERLKLYARISPILTPEQREKVRAFQARLDDFVDGVINRFGDRLGTE